MTTEKKYDIILNHFYQIAPDTVEPDKDIKRDCRGANIKTYVRDITLGFIISVMLGVGATYAVKGFAEKVDPNSNTPKKSLMIMMGMFCSVFGVGGASIGAIMASATNNNRMDYQTRKSRAAKITNILNNQSIRPLTQSEYDMVKELAKLRNFGALDYVPQNIAEQFTHEFASVDPGFYASLKYGNLRDATPEIRSAIEHGYEKYLESQKCHTR